MAIIPEQTGIGAVRFPDIIAVRAEVAKRMASGEQAQWWELLYWFELKFSKWLVPELSAERKRRGMEGLDLSSGNVIKVNIPLSPLRIILTTHFHRNLRRPLPRRKLKPSLTSVVQRLVSPDAPHLLPYLHLCPITSQSTAL